MTIIIDGTVGANKGVVLDSNGKLPAIDGSQVTALSATQISSGTVATARLDTGTTAGKVLVLDGSGNMPAVDASLMTGVASATKSASNPTISTNPATGLGTKWINTTTGDVFVLTNATANGNVWTNTGAGSGDITPSLQSQGSTYGWVSGGYQGSPGSPAEIQNVNQYFPFASETNSTDASNLTTGRPFLAGASSTTYGYCSGGSPSALNIIDKFQFGTTNNSTDVGDLATGRSALGGVESTTHGYTFGGITSAGSGSNSTLIEKFAFASDGNSADTTADLTQGIAYTDGSASATYGYRHGGQIWPNAYQNVIDKWPFASSANASDVGDLTIARLVYASTCNSNTHGYTMGGYTWSDPTNYGVTIDKFPFATDSNATDVGDLSPAQHGACGVSGIDYGYASGGRDLPETTYYNNIRRISFSSDGNSTDSADLVNYPYSTTGNQV